MDGIQLSEPRIVPTGNNASPGKRKPEGKDALLTVKPPPLESMVSSPHKSDRGLCSSVCGPSSSGRCCASYTPFLAILGFVLLIIGLGLLGQEGKLAANSLSALLVSALGSTGGMAGRLLHAYYGAYVATVVIATLLAVFVIVAYLLRVGQRLKQDGRFGTGISTERRYIALEWVLASLAALFYAFCAWLAVYFGIMLLAFAGMMIARQGALFARNLFTAVLPILSQWLSNARASYTAMTSLLSQVPAVGKNAQGFVNTAFTLLIPTPDKIQAFLNSQTGGKLSYLITSLLGTPAGVVNGVRSCPAATCVDLSQYAFMKSDLCLCNSPLLLTLAGQAGDARLHLLRVLVGIALMYLGCSLLLSRLSAEAAITRYDVNLLWTNKFDRLMMRRSRTGDNGIPVGRASSTRAPTGAQNSPARGTAYAV